MNSETGEVEKLREAFASLSETAQPQPSCPAADQLWAALRGELSARKRRKLVDHMSSCPACAEAWRLARELGADLQVEVSASREPSFLGFPWSWRWASLAAATAIVLLVAGIYVRQTVIAPRAPVYREAEKFIPRSMVPEDQPLSRHNCLLRWSVGPEGSRYDLRVTTQELEVVVAVKDLEFPEYEIPEAMVRDLPPGAKLLWQVEVVLPDGGRLSSATFILHLQ